jgi:Zn ribbon nucleic-acid-binding protein
VTDWIADDMIVCPKCSYQELNLKRLELESLKCVCDNCGFTWREPPEELRKHKNAQYNKISVIHSELLQRAFDSLDDKFNSRQITPQQYSNRLAELEERHLGMQVTLETAPKLSQ